MRTPWWRALLHDAVLTIVISACLAALLLLVLEVHFIWQHS